MNQQQLLKALAEDELEKVFQALEPLCGKNAGLQQDWVNLSGRFQQLINRELRGTASPVDIGIERNQIREALQLLIGRVFAPTPGPVKKAGHFFQQWRWPLAITGVSILLLAIGMLPVRQVAFQAMVKCTDVNFRLAAAWPQTLTIPAQRFNLGPLQEVKGTGWQYQLDEVGQVIDLALDSGKADIGPLYIPADELLGIRSRAGEISFTLSNQSSGELNVFQGVLNLEPALGTRAFGGANAGDQLQWAAEPGAQLTFSPQTNASFQIPRQAIKSIEFIKKEGEVIGSAILSAQLDIKGQKSINLESADFLELDKLQDADFTLQFKQDTLEIKVQGMTNNIQSGLQKLQSQKPSLLEYLYHDQKIYFFVSVLVSLIGLLWSVKNALGLGKSH